jgi:hypothetical protein
MYLVRFSSYCIEFNGYSILVSYGDLDWFEGQEIIGLGSSMANEVVNNRNACSLGSLSFENCALDPKF